VRIKDRCVHAIGDISTVTDIDCRLTGALGQLFEKTADLISACVNYLVSFPAGVPSPSCPEVKRFIHTAGTFHDDNWQRRKRLVDSNRADADVSGAFCGLTK
jgi:hypothetical protein